jgi:DNA-binding CsgD family transcriptional regulator
LLGWLGEGKSIKEIARQLQRSRKTVQALYTRIKGKVRNYSGFRDFALQNN